MSCVWHEMWRPKRKRDVNTAVCLCWQSILIVYDGVWLQGVDALVERCPGTFRFPSLSFISSPYLTSLILLPVPPSLPLLPSEQSDHPCTLPPLSLSLSVFLCFALMSPSPAGCCGQTSRSDLHPLPCLPLFLCLSFPPSIDSTFPVLRRYSQISVSARLARFIFVISSYKPRN